MRRVIVREVVLVLSTIVLTLLFILPKQQEEAKINAQHMEEVILPTITKPQTHTPKLAELCTTGATFKSYMDYRKVTMRGTKTYEFLNQPGVYVGQHGIMMYQGAFVVAMSKIYGQPGDSYWVHMESGYIFKAVIGDNKSVPCYHGTGNSKSIIEMVVAVEYMDDEVRYVYGDFSYYDMFKGEIKYLELVEDKNMYAPSK